MKHLSPIILFVYNRPEETQATISALQKNILAKESDLYIFSDGAKNTTQEENVDKIREIIRSVEGFNQVSVIEAEKNKGLANSIIDGVSEIIQKYGKVIVLEDDLVTSPNFLSFMNQSLDFYQDNKNIISTTGFTFNISTSANCQYDIYFTHRMCSYGWGTWLDRWDKIDWNVSDYDSFKYSLKKNLQFMRGGEDLPRMLSAYMKGKINSWAIRFAYHQYKTNTYTVYPTQSLIDNIGFGEGGTNTTRRKKYDTINFNPSNNIDFKFSEKIVIDKTINKSFLKKYRIINRIIANYIIR